MTKRCVNCKSEMVDDGISAYCSIGCEHADKSRHKLCLQCGKYLGKDVITDYCSTDCACKAVKEANVATLDPIMPVSTSNDGSNRGTTHYDLPEGATELKHLIWYKEMNGQVAEIFRACYRLGNASHSSKERDLRKIIAYAEQELERMEKYE